MLHRLFAAAMLPYLTILEGWLYQGSLAADKRSEFFIHTVAPWSAADAHGGLAQHDGAQDEVLAGGWKGSSASVYWHRFAMRVGGDVLQSGRILAFSSAHVQLDAGASRVDDYYCGMTLSVQLTSGQWESCIITGYLASKRRVLVQLMGTPAEKAQYTVSTVVPECLRPLAMRILAAGKSVNVLLFQRHSHQHLTSLLSRSPCLVSSFLEGMAASAPSLLAACNMTDADACKIMCFEEQTGQEEEEEEEREDHDLSEATTLSGMQSAWEEASDVTSHAQSVESSPTKSHASNGSHTPLHPELSPRSPLVQNVHGAGGEEDAFFAERLHAHAHDSAVTHLARAALPHTTGFHLCDLFHASLEEGSRAGQASQENRKWPETCSGGRDWQAPQTSDLLLSSSPLFLPSCSLDSILAHGTHGHSWRVESGSRDRQENGDKDRHQEKGGAERGGAGLQSSSPTLSQHAMTRCGGHDEHLRLSMAYPMVPFASVMHTMLLQVPRLSRLSLPVVSCPACALELWPYCWQDHLKCACHAGRWGSGCHAEQVHG